MDHTKLLLIGGGGAVGLMALLYFRAKSTAPQAQAQASAAQDQAGLMSLSSMTPISGGITTADGGGSYNPPASVTSGATGASTATDTGATSATADPTMSMFAALLPLFQTNANNQHTQAMTQIGNSYMLGSQSITAGLNANDSTLLAQLAQGGASSATLAHAGNNTSINVSNPTTDLVSQEYQKVLGRAPDAAGLAYWSHAVSDGTYSMANFDSAFKNAATPELQQKKAA